MAFPPAHLLVGAGFAEVARAASPNPPPRWKAWAVGGCVAMLPDVDMVLGIVRGVGGAYHGTFTHSILAVLACALVAYLVGGGQWAAVVGLAYGSHLLVDLLDDSGPTNLMLGWPFSTHPAYSLGKFFPKVPIEGYSLANTIRIMLLPASLRLFALQTALAAACCAALLLLAAAIRRVRERRVATAAD